MKKALCLFLVAVLFALSGCVNQKPMKAYWDGETFVVENAVSRESATYGGGTEISLFIGSLDHLEEIFKRVNYKEAMIVLAKKGDSTSYYYGNLGLEYLDCGEMHTFVTIEKVFWSSSEALADTESITLVESCYYKENGDGNLEFCIFDTIPPQVILSDDAEYYILFLLKYDESPDARIGNIRWYYGTNWWAYAGFKVNASTRAAVANGVNPEGKSIGRYPHLYKEAFEKYVD